jgi:predicted ATPase
MRATLDWSYRLLSEAERKVLRRLAIFAGDFTLEAASRVAAGAEIAAYEVIEHLAGLVTKSLIEADVRAEPHYRLLGTTRDYALEKLLDSGEVEQVERRQAA